VAAAPAVGTPGLEAPPPLTIDVLIMEQRNSALLGESLRAADVNPPDLRPDGR
jgi:hypothetical protein